MPKWAVRDPNDESHRARSPVSGSSVGVLGLHSRSTAWSKDFLE
jgi:hypothetical protein